MITIVTSLLVHPSLILNALVCSIWTPKVYFLIWSKNDKWFQPLKWWFKCTTLKLIQFLWSVKSFLNGTKKCCLHFMLIFVLALVRSDYLTIPSAGLPKKCGKGIFCWFNRFPRIIMGLRYRKEYKLRTF
jgi:hypothetical protein